MNDSAQPGADVTMSDNANLDVSAQWQAVLDLWGSRTPMHVHVWKECTHWLKDLLLHKLLVPGEGSLLHRLPDPTTSRPGYTDELFWNEFRLCQESEIEVSNRGVIEKWSVGRSIILACHDLVSTNYFFTTL